ncbi:tetratricopeptide repeat protein [Bdellovibrio bacteriovorus]|uniref:tetratricopeptide repeat protein n=1 Tax=Bdellovibrio bacteriovorus TaxID=959 RepID=UPI0035A6DAA3
MKTLNDILVVSAFLTGILSSPQAFADKMNAETQDLVIKKMERVLSAMEKTDNAWLSSQQRLADLLSERARTRFMSEIEAGCEGCKGSKDDRQKAVKIYETILQEVKVNEHGPILFQLAHLYEMAGQNDKAIALYESIIKDAKKKNINAEIVTRSRVGLGDLLFQKGRFADAREHYKVALKDKNLQNRYLTIYNVAWCEYNTDNLKGAIATLEDLLRNPEMIRRETEDGSKYDAPFHTDMLRDLATFYTKQDVTTREINTFEALAPIEKRKDLMLYFAKETDRIGQKKPAQEIMSRYLADNALSKEERIEASIQLAQINYDRGNTKESVTEFGKAAAALQKSGCSGDKCEELQKTMKRYVTELHRSKKLKPDQDLMSAYLTYNKTFPADMEMTQRGAAVAMEMGNFPVAVTLYRTVSESRSFSQKEREEALLNEVSAAEKSKNPSLQRDAYIHYLKYAPRNAKSFEVKYQLAYLSYQQKQYADAAESFEDLAKDKNGTADLRKKAADLSLDALAQLKNEKVLEDLAWDYSEIFPQARAEFEGIARKSLMNRVARVANDSRSSSSDLKKALASLDTDKVKNASSAEKILFYNNQSVLAKKLDDEKTYIAALTSLMAVPGLTSEQRENALEQMTGYYEKKLDFKNAYVTALRLQNAKISEKEKEFRLGTLADLAGLDASKHYRRALDAGLRGERSLIVRSRLVLTSSNPARELKTQARELKQRPALLNETALLVYAQTGDASSIKSVLEMKEMRKQSAPLFIKKQAFYTKAQETRAKIADSYLSSNNDRALQKSIAARVALLKKADALLAESLPLKDVTAQMMALAIVSYENERMVRDLASLPLPEKLSPQEQRQYISLLKAQSKPFLYKARVAQQKQQEIWNRSPGLAQTLRDFKVARPEIRNLLARELTLLNQIPGKGPMKTALEDALDERQLSSRDLVSARQSVAADPANIRSIENLKLIETKIGHPLMPAYLEARISHLQRGKSL